MRGKKAIPQGRESPHPSCTISGFIMRRGVHCALVPNDGELEQWIDYLAEFSDIKRDLLEERIDHQVGETTRIV